MTRVWHVLRAVEEANHSECDEDGHDILVHFVLLVGHQLAHDHDGNDFGCFGKNLKRPLKMNHVLTKNGIMSVSSKFERIEIGWRSFSRSYCPHKCIFTFLTMLMSCQIKSTQKNNKSFTLKIFYRNVMNVTEKRRT